MRHRGTTTDLSSDSQQRGQSIGAGCRWSGLGYTCMMQRGAATPKMGDLALERFKQI